MRRIIASLKQLGALGGIDIQRIEHTLARARTRLYAANGISLVIDVGANKGQYGKEIRKAGYVGNILSFEPIPEAFGLLSQSSRGDTGWEIRNCALGQKNCVQTLKVSENLASSSLLDVTSISTAAHSGTQTVRAVEVAVRTLDDELTDSDRTKRTHLKIDTQGSELDVLLGATKALPQIATIECELSLVPLYDGQPLFAEVCQHLYDQGFVAVWIERGFQSKDGELLQVDALFRRRTAEPPTGRA